MKSPHRASGSGCGGELTYHAFGSGQPLLFIAGLGASWQGFRNQITHLSSRYRCLAWDYRGLFRDRALGVGRVPLIADHARDALTILNHEAAGRAAVLGWSLGVQVAIQLFAAAPERVSSLVLVGGGVRAPWGRSPEAGPVQRGYPALLALLERLPGPLAALLRAGGSSARDVHLGASVRPGRPRDRRRVVRGGCAREWVRIDLHAALHTTREMMEHDLSDVLRNVDIPTLVIGGDRDPFTSRAALERLVRGVAGAEYLLLPGASHYLLMDHAQHVNLRIDKFFAERGFTP